MKKLVSLFVLFLSVSFLHAETITPIYKLQLKSTDRTERIAVSAYVEKVRRVKPHCEHCLDCDDFMECKGCVLSGCGWGSNYETVYTEDVAGIVYRGKYNSSGELMEVVQIYFNNYFDSCVETGTYEYVAYDNFTFENCSNLEDPSGCKNHAEITVDYHETPCLPYPEVRMTKEEFDAMKYIYTAPDDDEPVLDNDMEVDDIDRNDDANENSLDSCEEESLDVEVYEEDNVPDNDAETEISDSNETQMNAGKDKDPFYDFEKNDADGCALLIL